MSKKASKKIAPPYIHVTNCNLLLGERATLGRRNVAEFLELAIHFFLKGFHQVTFPIKKNGKASIKKALPFNNAPSFALSLVNFTASLIKTAQKSQFANDLFKEGCYHIEIMQCSDEDASSITVSAIRNTQNTHPVLILKNGKTEPTLKIPLLAVMHAFTLRQNTYANVGRLFFVANDQQTNTYSLSTLHSQNKWDGFKIESTRGFHDWLLHHFETMSTSTSIEIVSVNRSLDMSMTWQNNVIERSARRNAHALNIVPGGLQGRQSLQQLGLFDTLGDVTLQDISESAFLDAIEKFSFMEQPGHVDMLHIKALWKAQWRSDVPAKKHLTAAQVGRIKTLGSYNMSPNQIKSWVGASSVAQVRRVLDGTTYSNIPPSTPM